MSDVPTEPRCPVQVYEHLVFEGSQHVSLRSLEGMQERSIRIGSAGKTFSFTSWKVRISADVCLPPLVKSTFPRKLTVDMHTGNLLECAEAH